uniref:Uncharacterized protein n=1 Tax=Anguilla anguilla TaxID=7936 RepID=A0A0E9WR03_ANGAN
MFKCVCYFTCEQAAGSREPRSTVCSFKPCSLSPSEMTAFVFITVYTLSYLLCTACFHKLPPFLSLSLVHFLSTCGGKEGWIFNVKPMLRTLF